MMAKQGMLVLFILLVCAIGVASAETVLTIPLAWETPLTDTAGNPKLDLDYYNLYICGSPIVQEVDNESKTVECEHGIKRIKIDKSSTHEDSTPYALQYEINKSQGTLYFRVSAVDETGLESDLSNEVSYAYGVHVFESPKALRVLTIIISP